MPWHTLNVCTQSDIALRLFSHPEMECTTLPIVLQVALLLPGHPPIGLRWAPGSSGWQRFGRPALVEHAGPECDLQSAFGLAGLWPSTFFLRRSVVGAGRSRRWCNKSSERPPWRDARAVPPVAYNQSANLLLSHAQPVPASLATLLVSTTASISAPGPGSEWL
ncbi:hypothetical protein C8T65DRAFT_699334 [Cerioporus squamosus]|nr:hypothetical protein C8T65DRAFT_699334 [Cerioporus squamosus]